jgi:hypothetical protein
MTLQELRYFCVTAEVLHYTRAANLLYISQPSLSYAIGKLEKELGVPLFEKNGKKVSLTKYGKEFFPYAKRALSEVSNGIDHLQEMQQPTAGIINLGYIYIAQPPLYGLKKGNSRKIEYIFNDDALARATAAIPEGTKYTVQRYKGLGEMDPEQLWSTTMEPNSRTLVQVNIDNAARAERVVSELMGSLVEPRRDFITKHANDARFLDF